jgi:hypothetical protein
MSNKIQSSNFTFDALIKLSRSQFDALFSTFPAWIAFNNGDVVTSRSSDDAEALRPFYPGESDADVARRDLLIPIALPADLLEIEPAILVELLFDPGFSDGTWDHESVLDSLWNHVQVQQPGSVTSSDPFDNDDASSGSTSTTFHVAPPSDSFGFGEDKNEEPEHDGAPIAVQRKAKIGQVHARADVTLKEVLDAVGPAVWCAWVGANKDLPEVARQGKRVTPEQLVKHGAQLARLNVVTPHACRVFFVEHVKGALKILLEDVFGALNNERTRIVSCDGFQVTTLVSRYDFHAPVVERLQIKDKVLLDAHSSTLAALRAKLVRVPVPQVIGKVTFSKEEVFGIFAMFFHRAYGGEKSQPGLDALPSGSFYYFNPQLINDGKGTMSLQNKVVVISVPVVELTQNFQQHKASAAVAYLAGKYGPDYNPQLVVKYGDVTFDVIDWFMQMVGYNAEENLKVGNSTVFHGFGLALQRARNLRKNTMMDAEYKNSYAFLKLGANYFVKYDGTLCAVLHVVARFAKQVSNQEVERALVCLDKSANSLTILSLLNSIRQERNLDIKVYFPNGTPENADGFHQGTDPIILTTYPNRYLCGNYDKEVLVKATHSSLIWMCNPANGNDYISLGKVKDVEGVVFSSLVKCAYNVYRLISFATSIHINAAENSFNLLYGDVESPYKHYWTESGAAVPIENCVTDTVLVPIGHAPHTTQRLAYYKVKGDETVVRINPPIVGKDMARLDKFQIKECLAFSQHRYQMLGAYESEEIMSLGLTRAEQVLEQSDTVASSDF